MELLGKCFDESNRLQSLDIELIGKSALKIGQKMMETTLDAGPA